MTLPRMPEALLVVDVQRGFADPVWGRRNSPACEENVARLIDTCRRRGGRLVFVRHDSHEDGSPLAAGAPDLLVTKHVNSSFLGDPPLDPWLREHGIDRIAIGGIQTNMCCETTARHGGNLGFGVRFARDATHTFDLTATDGSVIAADLLTQVAAAHLHGEFATVVQRRDVL